MKITAVRGTDKNKVVLFLIFGAGPTLPGQLILELTTSLRTWLDGQSRRLQIDNRCFFGI